MSSNPITADTGIVPAITRALTLFGTVPVIVLGLLVGVFDFQIRRVQAQAHVTATASTVVEDLSLFLSVHQGAIKQLAGLMPMRADGQIASEPAQRVLDGLRKSFPGFVTAIIADDRGNVLAGSHDGAAGVSESWLNMSVADRAYFRFAREQRRAYLSSVFIGRGFGKDLLCAASAPVLGEKGQVLAVVQGAISLSTLAGAFESAASQPDLELLVLDSDGRVAFRSESLPYAVLQVTTGEFDGLPKKASQHQSVALRMADGASQSYIAARGFTPQGWSVIAVRSSGSIMRLTLVDMALVALLAIAVGLAASILGRRYAAGLLHPVVAIAERMDEMSIAAHPLAEHHPWRFAELARLEAAFARMTQRLATSYRKLQDDFETESALRVQLARAQVQSERMDRELTVARDIQLAMVPSEAALDLVSDTIELAGRLEPARAVGGDFFNVVAVDDSTLSFFIGDVSDKGVPAALFMARLVTLLDGPLRRGDRPSDVLAKVGRHIAIDNPADMFATTLVGQIDLSSGHLRLASAGHDAPLLMHADGEIAAVRIEGGPALGIELEAQYPEVSVKLQQGDVLLLFTDGLVEAVRHDGEMFGMTRVIEWMQGFRSRSAHQVVLALTQAVRQFQSDTPPNDDLCMLCLRLPPELSGQVLQDGDLLQSRGMDNLPALLDAMERRLRFLGFRQNLRDDARLVTEEIFTNACLHGSRGPTDVTCEIRSVPYEDGLFLELMDDGMPFDPLAQNLPDVDAELEDREVGGLGVFLVRTLSSEVNYHREGDHNVLQLVLNAGRKIKGA
ncbi:MAG: SpoIIE family protein phosphatase [Aquimonas sp.]|nr:SpoIIE family protein phosphatase [Aquimonas sp.]